MTDISLGSTFFKVTLILCYVYGCFDYMYVCAPDAYLVLADARRGCWIPRKLELWMVVSHHVDAWN